MEFSPKLFAKFIKHRDLLWRQKWASSRPFLAHIFFLPSSAQHSLQHLCSTKFSALFMPCKLLYGPLRWLVIIAIFFFFPLQKVDNVSEAYFCPLLTSLTKEIQICTRQRDRSLPGSPRNWVCTFSCRSRANNWKQHCRALLSSRKQKRFAGRQDPRNSRCFHHQRFLYQLCLPAMSKNQTLQGLK